MNLKYQSILYETGYWRIEKWNESTQQYHPLDGQYSTEEQAQKVIKDMLLEDETIILSNQEV